MSPRQILESALGEEFVDEGEPASVSLIRPGDGMNELHFRAEFKRPMPAEIRDLLDLASGFRLGTTEVQFTEYHFQGYDFLIPDWVEVCADGFGNHWVAEIQEKTHSWGPVWFASHDPPVIVYVAASLSDFIEQVLDAYRARPRLARNGFACSHDDAMTVWRAGRPAIEARVARQSGDLAIVSLARELPDRGVVIDMRGCRQGEGFAWAEFDAYRPVRRGDDAMVFGLVREGP